MLADGGEAIADLAVLRNQGESFGPVASDATAWRLLDGIDDAASARIRAARARGPGAGLGAGRRDRSAERVNGGGFTIAGFMLDLDATIVVCHSPGIGQPLHSLLVVSILICVKDQVRPFRQPGTQSPA